MIARPGLLVLVALLAGAGVSFGASLDQIAATVWAIRAEVPRQGPLAARGATARHIVLKHQLREWVEGQLALVAAPSDAVRLAGPLLRQLQAAGVTLVHSGVKDGDYPDPSDWGRASIGTVTAVRVQLASKSHIWVTLGVGIECGSDHSVYLYERTPIGWQRRLNVETNDFGEQSYEPIDVTSLSLSAPNPKGERIAALAGTSSWCTSNWGTVYYQARVLAANGDERSLLSNSIPARRENAVVVAQADEFVVQFNAASMDSLQLFHPVLHRYQRVGGTVRRVQPFAADPQIFVSEWLQQDDRLSLDWALNVRSPAFYRLSEMLPSDDRTGRVRFTKHERCGPGKWQVPFGVTEKGEDEKYRARFWVVVQGAEPADWRIAVVREKPLLGCKAVD